MILQKARPTWTRADGMRVQGQRHPFRTANKDKMAARAHCTPAD